MCRRHLNPGGLITQWVPLYESNAETVKSELATFFEVFPDGTMWGNDVDGGGYDSVLLGQAGPLTIDLDEAGAAAESPGLPEGGHLAQRRRILLGDRHAENIRGARRRT